MSNDANFIARWSRRKREAVQESQQATEPDANASKPAPQASAATGQGAELPFDVSSLPSIESITAETDLRAFLAPGVPAELTRAALRRAWTIDPNIRNFVGLSENSWDFNAPGAITGFGPLEMTAELRREIVRMVGRSLTEATETPPAGGEPEVSAELATDVGLPTDAATDPALSQDESVKSDSARYNSSAVAQRETNHTAMQNIPAQPDNNQLIAKRSHGRALPK
jgi:hypothetical protein